MDGPSFGNPDYQGGTSNTSDPQDNSFRNIDRLPLGKLLQVSFGRKKSKGHLRKIRTGGFGKSTHGKEY